MRRLAHLRHKANRLRSVAWAASESLISPVMQLALTPVLLHHLGTQQFGIWALSLMIAGLGSLASLGAPTATMKKVAELGSSPSTPDVESHIRAALRVALMGTTVIGLIIIVLALLFDGKVDADGPPSRLYVALGLSLCVLIVQELDNVISSSLKGAERFDLVAKVDIRYRVIWMLAVAACGWFFQSVMFCILAGFLVNSVKFFNKISIAKRYYNINIDFSEKASRAALQEITSLGKWYWAQAFAAFLFNTADRWLIVALFGLDALAAYAICLQLAQVTHTVQASACQVLVPWASRNAANGRIQGPEFLKLALLGGVVCLVMPACIAIGVDPILSWWISPDFASQNYLLALALLLSFAILAANIPLYYILVGVGEVRLVTILNLVGGVLSLSLGALTSQYGTVAFALSKAVYGSVTLLAGIPLLKKKYG